MKKNLLFVICSVLLLCAGNVAKASSPVTFTGGHTQFLAACENGPHYSINGLLAITDSDLGETETWSVVTNASHGTLAAGFSTTSTGTIITPTGLTYTPAIGYVGIDSFSVEVSDGATFDTTMIYVTVNPLPVAGTISGGSSVCIGASFTLTASVSGGTWSASNAHATVSGGIVSGIIAGIDTISYSVTNSCGTATATQAVTIDPIPAAGPLAGASAVCVGGTITLTGASTGGSWSTPSADATVVGGAVTGVAGGVATISYITSGTCGMDTATMNITIDTGIVTPAGITGTDTMCAGAMTTLSNTSAGGVWTSTSLGAITSAGILTADSATSGADTVIYSLTNGCGTGSVSHTVFINPLPFAGVITGFDSVCAGSTITLTTTGTGGVWSSNIPEFAAVDATGHVIGGLNGTSVIRYTVTNACGTASATHTVRVNIPAQPIIGDASICQLALSMFIDAVGGGTWSSSDFLTVAILGGNAVGLQLGTATITYTVSNACGTTSATLDVEVIDCANGVNEVAANNTQLSLSPNPNTGAFTIQLPSSASANANVVITNVLGAKVKEFTMNTNQATEVNMDVPAGVYFLSATVNNTVYTTKMVIAK
ncbi:hypothetical protein CJD36_007680 [Flavipsychrobacter stenotrophus]|uniref:Secretion system C-terminal sorting domain-containing protein n=1 Tax=Flavipsychrobacter stenotrophus TaxID=2077091 RepID=A0A2S7SYR2_9BACT|nr:T9SS type A sorting domain-containing protein [Flavipsychrobacter stenotrophus]PQJ11666.1 hypothetical protein CJD36_007680 [Flavipsychrobacter stenotrophus]